MVSETAFPTFRLASDEAVFPDRFPLILEPSSQPVLADLTPQTQLALALRDQQAATINRGGIGVELVGDTSVTLFTWYRFIVLTATVALYSVPSRDRWFQHPGRGASRAGFGHRVNASPLSLESDPRLRAEAPSGGGAGGQGSSGQPSPIAEHGSGVPGVDDLFDFVELRRPMW